nr:MAG TPA: hypothetical protein [Caudoviricetes sp.]
MGRQNCNLTWDKHPLAKSSRTPRAGCFFIQ